MLQLDLQRILEEKGIENPHRYLLNNGFTRHTASNLLHNQSAGINFKLLEKLCLLLLCTPNDLLKWNFADKTGQYKNHPLQKLMRAPSKGNIGAKLKQLPLDKLEQVRNFVEGLEKEGSKD